MQMDRWTDMTKVIVACRYVVKALKTTSFEVQDLIIRIPQQILL